MSGERHSIIRREHLLPFILVTALFFFWGVPNNLNDVLIKQFMKSFELSRLEAGLVQSAFYMGYFLLSLPAALLMRRFSYKAGLVAGLLLFSLGTFLFYPAALAAQFGFFLFALFVIASGLAFLETGANSFISVLGDQATSERRLNLAQAFNPIGAIAGVLIGTFFILSGVELSDAEILQRQAAGTYEAYLRHETMRVVTPYLVISAVTFIWALILLFTRLPHPGDETDDGGAPARGRFRDLFRYRHFLLGVLAQFFYVGAQVGTWSFFIQYAQDYTGATEKFAGYLLAGTLGMFLVGRFLAAYAMRLVPPARLMGVFALANVLLVAVSVTFPGWAGLWAVFLTSFFMSLMFPTIFALGVKGLGVNTKIGGSLIIMAIVGGAVFTPVMGALAESSMALAMLVPLVSYLFISLYSFLWSRPSWSADRG
mgnify:CR=1 FL=1|jgi:FHS family L-fucose permease-like MFS transporter